jgi:hypothetical protein
VNCVSIYLDWMIFHKNRGSQTYSESELSNLWMYDVLYDATMQSIYVGSMLSTFCEINS